MPPIVARLAVEVSGPKIILCGASAAARSLRTTPGWTRAQPASALTSTIRFMYLEKSITTARPTACPARLVPPPRGSTGTPARRVVSSAACTSAASRGRITPIGSIS